MLMILRVSVDAFSAGRARDSVEPRADGGGDERAPWVGAVTAPAASSGEPQPLQNREPGGGVVPQLAHTSGNFAPQPLQNVEPAGGSCPQLLQITRRHSGARKSCRAHASIDLA